MAHLSGWRGGGLRITLIDTRKSTDRRIGVTQHIGFIGAGMMGSGVCRNLLKAGHALTITAHRNRTRIEELLKLGAKEARSTADLAKSADAVMLCVDRAETVERILAELSPSLRRGQLVIDVTTGRPDTAKKLAAALAGKGVTYIDAPVVGTPMQAADGKLASLVGADPATFETVRPLLAAYSTQVILFGPTGSGITAKLLNNFVTQSTGQLIIQAFRAARRHGVDWEKLYGVMLQGSARSGSLERLIGNAIQGNYKAQQFAIANAAKDIDYAGSLLGDDPDGARIQGAILGALRRPVEAGLGELFVSQMLDPDIERKAKS
jgi:3-hydroxyisobutyrate dehydrogenase-like beta-hydroxyacid dehydrogenase